MENSTREETTGKLLKSQCRTWILSNITIRHGEKTLFREMYTTYKTEMEKENVNAMVVLPQTFGYILYKCFRGYKRNRMTYDHLVIKKHDRSPITEKIFNNITREKRKNLHPPKKRLQLCSTWINENCIPVHGINTRCTVVYDAFIQSVPPHMYLDIGKVRV